MFGISLEVTHTGLTTASVLLDDYDYGVGIQQEGGLTKPGPVYVPVNGSIELIYTSEVAKSFEAGKIRGFIDLGVLTARFLFNAPTYVVGATAFTDGRAGTAPLPLAGQEGLFLRGDGTWAAAGAGSVDSAVLLWGSNSVGSSTTTRFLHPFFDNSLAQTLVIQYRVPRAGTIKNFQVRHRAGAGNGNNILYTFRVNGVATTLSVTMASTASDGSDLVSSVAVVAGDLVDVVVTKALGVGSSPNDIVATAEFAA